MLSATSTWSIAAARIRARVSSLFDFGFMNDEQWKNEDGATEHVIVIGDTPRDVASDSTVAIFAVGDDPGL